MTAVSKAAYARRHGVSKPAVSKWADRGLLVMVGGQVDVEQSDANLKRYRDPNDGRADRKPRSVKPAPPAADPGDVEPDAGPVDAGLSTEEARRVSANYAAYTARLEYDLKSGTAVLVADVARLVADEYAIVRRRLLAIPAECAVRVQAARSAAAAQELLTAAIHEALEGLKSDAKLAAH